MKKILTLILIVSSWEAFSQQVNYSYDNHGNRTQRALYTGPSNSRMITNGEEDATKSQDEGMQLAMKHGISVFPNPTSSSINVKLNMPAAPDEQETDCVVYLLDNNAKVLSSQKQNSAQFAFDLSTYKSGIYFLKVVIKGETLFYKVVKSE